MHARPLALVLLATSVLGLGAATSAAAQTRVAVATTGPAWVAILANPAVQVSLDTTRIATTPAGRDVWLGFDLAEAWPAMEDVAAPYRRYEARMELDCAAERARAHGVRYVDVNGRTYDKPTADAEWIGFAEHALTRPVLVAACRRLGER